LDFEIDGIVIPGKNDYPFCKEELLTAKIPRLAIAYKLPKTAQARNHFGEILPSGRTERLHQLIYPSSIKLKLP